MASEKQTKNLVIGVVCGGVILASIVWLLFQQGILGGTPKGDPAKAPALTVEEQKAHEDTIKKTQNKPRSGS